MGLSVFLSFSVSHFLLLIYARGIAAQRKCCRRVTVTAYWGRGREVADIDLSNFNGKHAIVYIPWCQSSANRRSYRPCIVFNFSVFCFWEHGLKYPIYSLSHYGFSFCAAGPGILLLVWLVITSLSNSQDHISLGHIKRRC